MANPKEESIGQDEMGEEIPHQNGTSQEESFQASQDSSTSTPSSSNEEGTAAWSPRRVIHIPEREKVTVNISSLLEAGAHYGHQCQRWNPKMLPNIFGVRNNVHIINLDITMQAWLRARKYIVDVASRGGKVLFVGTKLQAKEIIEQEALRSNSFYVSARWLGGTLSNFETIKRSINRMEKLEKLLIDAQTVDSKIRINKKERLGVSRELEKLEANLGGIRDMRRIPDLVFIVDINKEAIAVSEAKKLHIPIVALVDTNTDPKTVDFPIPSNDDAVKAIRLFSAGVSDAIREGAQEFALRKATDEKRSRAEKEAKKARKPEPSPATEAAAL